MRRLDAMVNSGESSPDSVLSELSVSFQKELTATIQGAFGVAVEIAVGEVSKLVAHALRDLHDRLHETLQTNRELESRLHATRTDSRTQWVHMNPGVTSPLMVQTDAPFTVQVGNLGSEVPPTHDSDPTEIKPDPSEHRSSAHQPQKVADIKPDHHGIETNTVPIDQTGFGMPNKPKLPATQTVGCTSREPAHATPSVAVKTEQPDSPHDPEPDCLSELQFSLEGISLAQSKLLEDWRPKPLRLQSCQTDAHPPSAISNLADPNFYQEIPGLNPHPPGASSQPDAFTAPLSYSDATFLSGHTHQHLYPTSSPGDVSGPHPSLCRFAGQSVKSLLQQLRWHHGQQHKGSRNVTFLPGRSMYRCSLCNRDFNRMEHLKIHQRIHTGEKPYPCTVCGARFRHSWALTRHLRIHTGEKPYLCTQCGKSFRNCGGLRFHQKNHAREKGLTHS